MKRIPLRRKTGYQSDWEIGRGGLIIRVVSAREAVERMVELDRRARRGWRYDPHNSLFEV